MSTFRAAAANYEIFSDIVPAAGADNDALMAAGRATMEAKGRQAEFEELHILELDDDKLAYYESIARVLRCRDAIKAVLSAQPEPVVADADDYAFWLLTRHDGSVAVCHTTVWKDAAGQPEMDLDCSDILVTGYDVWTWQTDAEDINKFSDSLDEWLKTPKFRPLTEDIRIASMFFYAPDGEEGDPMRDKVTLLRELGHVRNKLASMKHDLYAYIPWARVALFNIVLDGLPELWIAPMDKRQLFGIPQMLRLHTIDDMDTLFEANHFDCQGSLLEFVREWRDAPLFREVSSYDRRLLREQVRDETPSE